MIDYTDWISCTTPPVRDGFYDIVASDMVKHGKNVKPIRAEYRNGNFYGFSAYGEKVLMGAVKKSPDFWLWRGRRMWVIERPNPFDERMMYLEHLDGTNLWSTDLADAMAFETNKAAQSHLESRWPFGMSGAKVVQP